MVTFPVIITGLSHVASLLFPLQLDQAVKVTHAIPTAARVHSDITDEQRRPHREPWTLEM